jgi:hypothetical protein
MFQLVYISSAVDPFSTAELLDLLAGCREDNARAGVTGMLLYKDGNFMQVLEGDEDAVRATHARIERDPRHRGLITLLQGPSAGRHFPGWSMGLRELRSPEVISTPGFSPFLNTSLTGQEFSSDPTRCQRLLLMFKKSM